MNYMLPSIATGILSSAFGVAAAYFLFKTLRKRATENWIDLVGKIQQVDFENVTMIAQDYLNPQRGQIAMEPCEVWELIGGSEGIRKMRENVDVLLALAAYAQRWNFDESVIVYHRMRSDAAMLRRAAFRLRLGMTQVRILRSFQLRVPFRLYETVAAYYLMRQRLLSLYETSHAGLYPTLAASL
jgi:hypothetical protein